MDMQDEQDRGTFLGPTVLILVAVVVVVVIVSAGAVFLVYRSRLEAEHKRALVEQVEAERAMVLAAQAQADEMARKQAEARSAGERSAANTRVEVSTLPPGVVAHKNIEYARAGEHRLHLDLYLATRPTRQLPLLVWIHGGGWRQGSKDPCPLVWLTRHGYAVASIEYRLSGQAIFPAQIHDCKAAIRWLRAHASNYGYEPEKIGVAGISAGGHLAALLGTSDGVEELEGEVGEDLDSPSRVQAVVNMCGASDFNRIMNPKAVDDPKSTLAQLFGGPFSEKEDLARLASPATHVGAGDAPLLLIHGEKDLLVPLDQSEHLRDLYREAKLKVTLETIPGGVHASEEFWDPTRQSSVRRFFDEQFKSER